QLLPLVLQQVEEPGPARAGPAAAAVRAGGKTGAAQAVLLRLCWYTPLRARGAANPTGRAVDDPPGRDPALGKGDGPEVAERDGHVLPVEEGGSPDDAGGHAPGPPRLLQRPGLRVGAVEDREVATLPLLREAPHRALVRDRLGLRFLVVVFPEVD